LGRVTYCCSWSYGITKPVIATKINGNKDTVVHKETGFIPGINGVIALFQNPKIQKLELNLAKNAKQDVRFI
jgi:hypothetical protein